MEKEFHMRPELTGEAQNAYSNSRGINMPEGNVSPDINPEISKPPNTPKVSPEVARKMWQAHYGGKDIIDPDERSAIEQAISLGMPPMGGGSGDGPGESEDTETDEEQAQGGESGRNSRRDQEEDFRSEIVNSSRERREAIFNNLFISLSSRPDEFSDNLFSPLTNTGRQYELFIESLSRASLGLIKNSDGGNFSDSEKEEFAAEVRKYQREKQAYLIIHDVSAILYRSNVKPEQLFGFLDNFESSLGDMILASPGISQMMNIYEFCMRESMWENDGYLDPNKLRAPVDTETKDGKMVTNIEEAEIEARTKDIFKDMVERGMIRHRTKDGKEVVVQNLKPWEIDRLFIMTRGMMIVTQRTITIAAESRHPRGEARYASAWLQDIIQSYSSFAHMHGKWNITAEALAAYLYDGKSSEDLRFFFSRWNPKQLKDLYEKYENNPDRVLEDLNKAYYLGRKNPNRAGDMWTWISWRAKSDPDVNTMLKNYTKKGQVKMAERWDRISGRTNGQAPTAAVYLEFMKRPDFQLRELTDEEFESMSAEEIKEHEEGKEKLEERRNSEWDRLHPNAPKIKDFIAFRNEYDNWTGTAFRLEKLRAKLEGHGGHGHGHETEKARQDAETIIEQMVKLQPHRLFMISRYIQKRIGKEIKDSNLDMSNAHIAQALKDLAFVEEAFLMNREDLLDKETPVFFKDAVLDGFYDGAIAGDIEIKNEDGTALRITRDERISRAKQLANLVKDDFSVNREKYTDEFIDSREFAHGFVLWNGDIPFEEYTASAVGPTGAFARRARDNKNQTEAATAEIALLDNLKNFHSPDQLLGALHEVFAPIDHYDRGKAKVAIAEKLIGVLRFYKEDTLYSRVPIVNILARGTKNSMARLAYGQHAMSLQPSSIRYIVQNVGHTYQMDEEWEHKIINSLGANDMNLAYELMLNGSELGIFALFLGLMEEVIKELPSSLEG